VVHELDDFDSIRCWLKIGISISISMIVTSVAIFALFSKTGTETVVVHKIPNEMEPSFESEDCYSTVLNQCMGVPRWRPHRRSGLANLLSVGVIP